MWQFGIPTEQNDADDGEHDTTHRAPIGTERKDRITPRYGVGSPEGARRGLGPVAIIEPSSDSGE